MGKIDVNMGAANQLVLDIEDIPMSIGPGVSQWLLERWQKKENVVIRSVFQHCSDGLRLILMSTEDAQKLQ